MAVKIDPTQLRMINPERAATAATRGMVKPQGIDTMRGQGAGHWMTDSAKNPALAELERAGLQDYTSPIKNAAPAAAPAGQAAAAWKAQQAAAQAAKLRLGMGLGMGAAGLAVAPSVGGAVGYGLGAYNAGQPVLPAMKEGFQRYGWTNLRGSDQ